MNIYRLFSTCLVMALMLTFLGQQPVSAIVQMEKSSSAALERWTVSTFEADETASEFQVEFEDATDHALISYLSGSSSPKKVFARPTLGNFPGNCGPGNSWVCTNMPAVTPKVGSVSNMAVHTYINSFKVGWAYSNPADGNDLYVYSVEYDSQMGYATSSTTKVFDFSVFSGYILVGAPWLVFDSNGHPHLTVLFSDVGTRVLEYIHWTATDPTNPCDDDATDYQCDSIVESSFYVLAHQLMLGSTNSPMIAYLQETMHTGVSLKFAHPGTYMPNCGPSLNWRCIDIAYNVRADSSISMDVGSTYQRVISYIWVDALNQTNVHIANYVGMDGNCGQDYRLILITPPTYVLDNLWKCDQIGMVGVDPPYISHSVKLDPENYPVVAYNAFNGVSFDLLVGYPNERIGLSAGDWHYDEIHSVLGVNSGHHVGLGLSNSGLGFVAFQEDLEYDHNLKIAYQSAHIYMPVIQR